MLSSRGEFAFGLLASPLGRSDVEKIDGFDGGSRSDVGFECEFLFGLLCLFERRGGCAGEAEEDGVVELGPLAAGLAAVHTLRVAFDLK